jgi:hypothetical protein
LGQIDGQKMVGILEINIRDGKRKTPYNIGLAIWRLKYFYETFVQCSTVVILLNFCAKNPPHSQAEKRYPIPPPNQILQTFLSKTQTQPFYSPNSYKFGERIHQIKSFFRMGKIFMWRSYLII